MVVCPRDPFTEFWDGYRYGLGAKSVVMDESLDLRFYKELPVPLHGAEKVSIAGGSERDRTSYARSSTT